MRNYSLLIIFSFLFLIACENNDDVSVKVDFDAEVTLSNNEEITIAFTKQTPSRNIKWEFPGGTPSESFDISPRVTYKNSGRFEVKLTNLDANKKIVKDNYINIIKFTNTTYTDMLFRYNSKDYYIKENEYVLISLIDKDNCSYYAETQGLECHYSAYQPYYGIKLYWTGDLNLSNANTSIDLYTDNTFVFLDIRNDHEINDMPFIVNFNSQYEKVEDCEVPNDGLWHKTGYYNAIKGMTIWGYYYYYDNYIWTEGINFYLPWMPNQKIRLWYNDYLSKQQLLGTAKSNFSENSTKIKQTGTL